MPSRAPLALFQRVDSSLPPLAVPVLTRVFLIFLCEMVPGIAGAGLAVVIGRLPGMLRDSAVSLGIAGGIVLAILVGCCVFSANLMASTEPEELRATRRNQALAFMLCTQLVVAPLFAAFAWYLFASMF